MTRGSFQAMLQAVGIDANLASLTPAAAAARTVTAPDYDVGCAGPSISVSSPVTRLDRFFGAKNTFTRFRDDAFNAALKQVKSAGTTAEMKAAMAKVQQVWDQTIPSVRVAATETMIYWSKTVHGLQFNQNATVFVGSAYIK
jgi:peptide/nickel transport system substrate-binding protein